MENSKSFRYLLAASLCMLDCTAWRCVDYQKSNTLRPVQSDMRNQTIAVKAPKIRNAFALHAKRRRAGAMKDRRPPRGGSRNLQREYRDEDYDS